MSKVHSRFTTKNGVKIDLLNLKGKAYMMVADRIRWFNNEIDSFAVDTEFITINEEATVAKVTVLIMDPHNPGHFIKKATGIKRETKANFSDHTEKAQTGAFGRALLMLGYGTAFAADELDEGERLADAPVDIPKVVSKEEVIAEKKRHAKETKAKSTTELKPEEKPGFDTSRRRRRKATTKDSF
jgi:hypothetical protein